MNVDTEWMWPIIRNAERRMEQLVASYVDAQGPTRDALQQAGRELLLLQSSDWPFLVSTGQAREYAVTRFEQHVDRFEQLARILESGPAGPNARALAEDLFERDKVFQDIDYRLFHNREGEPLPSLSSR
jgi:1,4-alpha-glucan branching enzyme